MRGPLSQFFSGIYLKPLDDAISKMNVTYLSYQDDILILCNTKRQLNRCKRKIMQVMNERHLHLSKRKTKSGEIAKSGFHFLGIEYLPTQMADNTNTTPVIEKENILQSTHNLNNEGGADFIQPSQVSNALFCMIPHARTLRKAREQVKMMVVDDVSLPKIKNYLSRWIYWWMKTSSCWNYNELVNRYIHSCWNPAAKNRVIGFFQPTEITLSNNDVQACLCTLALAA